MPNNVCYKLSKMPSISDTLLLPGQPIPLPSRAPAPQLGPGIYERNGQLRASLLGIPHFEGSVSSLFCITSKTSSFAS